MRSSGSESGSTPKCHGSVKLLYNIKVISLKGRQETCFKGFLCPLLEFKMSFLTLHVRTGPSLVLWHICDLLLQLPYWSQATKYCILHVWSRIYFLFCRKTLMDMYVPLFTMLEFIFYFGWLKVSLPIKIIFMYIFIRLRCLIFYMILTGISQFRFSRFFRGFHICSVNSQF